jgi:hypothetical protein
VMFGLLGEVAVVRVWSDDRVEGCEGWDGGSTDYGEDHALFGLTKRSTRLVCMTDTISHMQLAINMQQVVVDSNWC